MSEYDTIREALELSLGYYESRSHTWPTNQLLDALATLAELERRAELAEHLFALETQAHKEWCERALKAEAALRRIEAWAHKAPWEHQRGHYHPNCVGCVAADALPATTPGEPHEYQERDDASVCVCGHLEPWAGHSIPATPGESDLPKPRPEDKFIVNRRDHE